MTDININLLKENAAYLMQFRSSIKDSILDQLSFDDFCVAMSLLPSQSYGNRIADRLSKELGLINSDDLDIGDKKLKHKKDYLEIKGSLITLTNDKLNIVQLRMWQPNKWFLIYCIDLCKLPDIISDFFLLNTEQMLEEISLCKASSAHGTKVANQENKNKELAIHFGIKTHHHKRWKDNYNYNLFEIKSLINP